MKNKNLNPMKRIFSFFIAILILVLPSSSIVFAEEAGLSANKKTPAFYFSPADVSNGAKIIFDNVEPGEELTGYLQLSLLEDIPALFNVGFGDAFVGGGGLGEGGVDFRDLGLSSWISFPIETAILLEKKQRYEFPFTVSVPEDAAPGDYAGMFSSSLISYGDALKLTDDGFVALDELSLGVGARITIALGVEFILRVAGEVLPELTYNDLSYFLNDAGELNVVVDYKNVGNVSVLPKAHLVISDFFGKRLLNKDYPFSLISPSLGLSSNIAVDIDDFYLAYGIYNVEVELLYNVLSFSKDAQPLVYSAGIGSLKIYSIPWIVFLNIALVLLTVLIWLFVRTYRYVYLRRYSKQYIVREGDTLQSVSNAFKVGPKDIIIANDLKKPYFLQIGEILYIPIKLKI